MNESRDISTTLQAQVMDALQDKASIQIRGGNSKAFYGRKITADRRVNVSDHHGIVAYEPTELAITVRAGTPLKQLEAELAENNQQLPFEPPDFSGDATIGGAIAAGLSGPRRPYAGSARDNVLGVKIINGKGEILEFGGRVMKNVAGYDLSRLMAGSMGALGILLEVSLKLRPMPAAEMTLVQEATMPQALERLRQWRRLGLASNFTATAYDGERLYVRQAGGRQSLAAGKAVVGGEVHAAGEQFWRGLKNHQLDFFRTDQPLWRLSIRPASSALPLPGDLLIEWSGGLRWLKSHAGPDEIRRIATQRGGHATLFRNGDIDHAPFHPLPPGLMRMHQQVKRALDPHWLFNPGRMYQEL